MIRVTTVNKIPIGPTKLVVNIGTESMQSEGHRRNKNSTVFN